MTEVEPQALEQGHDIRSDSPSPSLSPTVALSTSSHFDRSASAASSVTSVSTRSASWQTSDSNGKRRGYIRPQATVFAESAKNRDSVMSLGTIAHLQYYFARTGLLDGKGGQLAKEKKDGTMIPGMLSPVENKSFFPSYSVLPENIPADQSWQLDLADCSYQDDAFHSASPDQANFENTAGNDVFDLAPTVSTYKQKPIYVQPPPNLAVLRRELREAMEDARKLMMDLESEETDKSLPESNDPEQPESPSSSQGWHEIQGLRVLDLVTLAIRAAKNYYTSHEQPQRLYSIRSERQIRTDLYAVLDVLKKLAARNFTGGVKKAERVKMVEWVTSIEDLVSKEEAAENAEHERHEKWIWREGGWEGRERERGWIFLTSFDTGSDTLPEWMEPTEANGGATPFLLCLQNGLRLCKLHNEIVKSSRRQFGEIKDFHTDTAKPYRCSENLKYWIKAAELRWDIFLDVDVDGVVRGSNLSAWKKLDAAVLKWCDALREEVTNEWREYQQMLKTDKPILRMDDAANASW